MDARQTSALSHYDREYRPALTAFFLRRVHDVADAEDLTQEVFTRIAARPDMAVASQGYIFQVAANLLRDRARRRRVRDDYLASLRIVEEKGVEMLDPYRIVAGRETLAQIQEGLSELPERTRQIFLLFRYENVDQRTIAESFGISVSAVAKHIYRAMAVLMSKVEEPR